MNFVVVSSNSSSGSELATMPPPECIRALRRSADSWVEFARELRDVAKTDVELELDGGLYLCSSASNRFSASLRARSWWSVKVLRRAAGTLWSVTPERWSTE